MQIANRNYKKLVYDFSKRFYDLRRDDDNRQKNGKKKTFKQISSEIRDLTGVEISHTQLSKYYNLSLDEDDQSGLTPNIRSVMAIADYYGVSVEYMLGLSDTKNYNLNYKLANAVFGLNDKSIETLEYLQSQKHIFNVPSANDDVYKKFGGTDFVDFILNKLLYELQDCCNRYFYEVQRLSKLENISNRTNIQITNIRGSIEDKMEIDEELSKSKDLVNYRKYKISQLVDSFVEELREELITRENVKEID